jgi:hypothetical protein
LQAENEALYQRVKMMEGQVEALVHENQCIREASNEELLKEFTTTNYVKWR